MQKITSAGPNFASFAVLMDDEGTLFLERTVKYGGALHAFGGKRNGHEGARETLVRELSEELGFVPSDFSAKWLGHGGILYGHDIWHETYFLVFIARDVAQELHRHPGVVAISKEELQSLALPLCTGAGRSAVLHARTHIIETRWSLPSGRAATWPSLALESVAEFLGESMSDQEVSK